MSLEIILFIILASIAVASSLLMITRPNPIISALFLIVNFCTLAGLYILLNAQFIAVTQIIVYAGAIMVLFLFVIMLLRPGTEKKFFDGDKKLKVFTIIVALFIFAQLVYMIFFAKPISTDDPDVQASIDAGTIEAIGRELYTNYIMPFEVAGFLLLAATIGAILLAKKKFD